MSVGPGCITYSWQQLYDMYSELKANSMLPVEMQWNSFYESLAGGFRSWGYAEKEIRWWFLRTGQGPECFTQYKEADWPSFDVWLNWFWQSISPDDFCAGGSGGLYATRYNFCSPPGFSMPYYDPNIDGSCNPATAGGALGIEPTSAFTDQSCAGGRFVHAVSPAFQVLNTKGPYGCFGPNGLPIAVMAYLDKATNKQWAPYFHQQYQSLLQGETVGISPTALMNTLSAFGITEPSVWSLANQLMEANQKSRNSCKKKRGFTIMMAGPLGPILFTIIAGAILSALSGAIMAAIGEAISAAAGVEAAASFGEIQSTLKTAQTVYSVAKQLTGDDINFLSLASSLVSLGGQVDALVDMGVGGGDWSPSLDFQMSDPAVGFGDGSLYGFTAPEASGLSSEILVGAVAEIDPSIAGAVANIAPDAITDAINSVVDDIFANLGDYSGDPDGLWAAIESATTEAVQFAGETIADAAFDPALQSEIQADVDTILQNDLALSETIDYGALDTSQFDQDAFAEGIADGTDYDAQVASNEENIEIAQASTIELSADEIAALLKLAGNVVNMFESAASPPPPPPAAPPVTSSPATAPTLPPQTGTPPPLPGTPGWALPGGASPYAPGDEIPLDTPAATDGKFPWWLLALAVTIASKGKL